MLLDNSDHRSVLLNLVRQKGLLRPADLVAHGIPRVYLTRLVASHQLERVGRGLYRLAEAGHWELDTFAQVAVRVPQAVFCLLSALQFHGLTTQLPREVWLALPRGQQAPKLNYPPIKRVQYSDTSYAEGVEVHLRDQVEVRVYGVAKTIADCFKHRNKIGLDVALEALRDVRRQNRATTDALWHYAKICRVANVMRPYLEATG